MRIPDRAFVLLAGVAVLFLPALLLALTLGFLFFVGDLVLGRLTPLELLELYVIELAVLSVFTYGLYRLVQTIVTHRLPESVDALDESDSGGTVESQRRDE